MSQAICVSFLKEILQGIHHPDDTYRLALFDRAAALDCATEIYGTDHECAGEGYEAGGKVLEGFEVSASGKTAWLSFDGPVIWPRSTITARFGLIFNSSRRDNAVCVIDFMSDKTSTNGNFRVDLPPKTVGLVRITGP